jgi:RNA polymerase sigma-70 factor (ECF subfamily)
MDGNEFKRRFLPYNGLIYKISYAITYDKQEAEDTVQDVFEKLWKIRGTLTTLQNDEAFIISIAKNMALDRYRRRQNRPSILLSTLPDTFGEELAENNIEQKELLGKVEDLLSTLPESQQMAMRLRHFSDLPIPQVAETMQVTQTNVRQLLSRARKTIKEKLENVYAK